MPVTACRTCTDVDLHQTHERIAMDIMARTSTGIAGAPDALERGRQRDGRIVKAATEAARSLAALGDAVEALPTQTSPQAARAVQATENIVRSVDAEFGLLGAAEAGERLGSSSKAARNLAGSRHRAGDLLAIRRGNRDRFPGFQFRTDGSPVPVVRVLLDLSAQHGWSESDLFLWLVTPTGRLDDARPVDVMLSGAEDAVASAAEMDMTTEW